MKDLSIYIKESNKPSFSKEELRKDYEAASEVTGQEKKDLIAKYGVTTKKTKDIQQAILLQLQIIRNTQKKFDEQDLRDFSRMYESDAQMIEQLKKENTEFAVYLRDQYFEMLKKRKIEKYAEVKNFNGFMMSNADKWQIKRYQKVDEYIKSEDPDIKAQKMKDEDLMTILNTKLTSELEDFKKEYLKRVEESASYSYDNLPKEIKKMEDILKEMKDDYEKKKPEIKGFNSRWKAEEPIRKYENKLFAKKAILRRYKTKNEFINVCVEDAEKTFKGNVDALTHRVYDKKFDVENIKVSNVKDDPKIFKLMIEDGTKKLYCRSVLAAEFSDKMVPHFRFIMTDRK